MATSARHLCRTVSHISRAVPSKRKSIQCQWQICGRLLSSSRLNRADETRRAPSGNPSPRGRTDRQEPVGEVLDETEYLTPQKPYSLADLSPAERADYELLSKEDQKQYLRLQNHFKAIFESGESRQELNSLVEQADKEIDREGGFQVSLDFPQARAKGQEIGYWAEDEEDEIGQMEDADDGWSEENITSIAESQMDLHRDIREYTRIAAWDLPLLQQYAKPFRVPTQATPLRFRYTTYMGEVHPAQNKVVVEFCSRDLLQSSKAEHKLSEAQRQKLLKLVGPRYNPDTDVVKMSCEKFVSAAQNKRYLGELVGTLIREAKDKRDTFDDVPLDLRHHRPRRVPVYPDEWKLTGKTTRRVLAARQETKALLSGGSEEDEAAVATAAEGEGVAVPVVDGRRLVAAYARASSTKPATNALT